MTTGSKKPQNLKIMVVIEFQRFIKQKRTMALLMDVRRQKSKQEFLTWQRQWLLEW
jgi:hypothetical protein